MNKLDGNFLHVYACVYCGERNTIFNTEDCEDCIKIRSLRKVLEKIPEINEKIGYGMHREKTYHEISAKKYNQYVCWIMSDECKTSYDNKKKMFKLYNNPDNNDFPRHFQ